LGASAGLIYNQNRLNAPYTFQRQPALRGAKTLLDLETDGFGLNGSFGILFKPVENLRFGLTYTSPSEIHSRGDASGNASAQFQSLGGAFASLRPDFHYDAEVINKLPQVVTGGVAWKPQERWQLGFQVDWINWSDAFDTLKVKLRHGNNGDLNGLTGSPNIDDSIPLGWEDRFVFRWGAEYALSESWWLRGGYSYGRSPVPDETLSPLTAAISEHTLSAGVGFRRGRYRVDLGYQYDLPATQRVGTSDLRSGEYSGSKVETSLHWVSLSVSIALSGSRAQADVP
jgi:long-subunit fatty acid transport protein